MNLNQIVNMFLKIVMRKTINSGVNATVRAASRYSKNKQPAQLETAVTPQEDGGQARRLAERDAIREKRRARRAARNDARD